MMNIDNDDKEGTKDSIALPVYGGGDRAIIVEKWRWVERA